MQLFMWASLYVATLFGFLDYEVKYGSLWYGAMSIY